VQIHGTLRVVDPDPLRIAMRALIADGTLDEAQARRVEDEMRPLLISATGASAEDPVPDAPAKVDHDRGSRLVEILAYLGGALVLAAVGVIVAMSWDSFTRAVKVGVSSGGAAILLGAAVTLKRLDPSSKVPSAVLAALASLSSGLALGVALDGISSDSIDDPGLLGGAAGIALISVPAYLAWRGWPLVLAIYPAGLLATIWGVGQVADADSSTGAMLTLTAYGVIFAAVGWRIPERNMAGFLGSGTVFVAAANGGFERDSAWLALALGVVLVVACFTLFARTRAAGYAVVGVLTALFVPAEAMSTLSGSAVMVAALLCAVGLALIVGAVILNRKTGLGSR
jgi:uncharacterized membrane protein